MNATKTTLCMLLAAAIGSAATATSIWETQRRDPVQRIRAFAEFSRGIRSSNHTTGSEQKTEAYRLPASPGKAAPWMKRLDCEEIIYDLFKQTEGETSYIDESIEGVKIAYTTPEAQNTFHEAMRIACNLDNDAGPARSTENIKRFIDRASNFTTVTSINDPSGRNTYTETKTPIQKKDGTPVIDYLTAKNLLSTAIDGDLDTIYKPSLEHPYKGKIKTLKDLENEQSRQREEERQRYPPHTQGEYAKTPNAICDVKKYHVTEEATKTANTHFLWTNGYFIEDRAASDCEHHGHIFETIDGMKIGYTTPLAQEIYHQAIASLSAKSEYAKTTHQQRVRHAIEISIDDLVFRTTRLNDGTPIIDYKHAGDLIIFADQAKRITYSPEDGQR